MTTNPTKSKSLQAERTDNDLSQERSIFRVEAQEHYLANQDRVVFPRLLSRKFFAILWVIALSLFILGSLITFWPLIQPLLGEVG